MVSIEDLESLEETLDLLANQALAASTQKGVSELAAGEGRTLTKDEALALARRR